MKSRFIFEQNPVPANHGSTLAETTRGLLAAWFGGPQARHPSVTIWSASFDGKKWSAPREILNGLQPDGTRLQCWNPVLFQLSRGPLLLFYKIGPNPEGWWGMLTTSTNDGATWSPPTRLPQGFVGPVRNKPLELPNGSLLCGSSTEEGGWEVHMETASPGPGGFQWTKTGGLNERERLGAIQPTILRHDADTLQILCRTRQGVVAESWSRDAGRSWSRLVETTLPNPNSAIDGLRLQDGRFLLVYNHSATERHILNVGISSDGKKWTPILELENGPGEYSYPAVIQSADGLVHITYTVDRVKIKHAIVQPARLAASSANKPARPAR